MGMTDEVAARLVALGLGIKATASVDGDIYSGFLPASPNNVISLYDSTGFEPIRAMGRRVQEKLNLQVMVRNVSDEAAENKAKAVYVGLDMFKGTLEGVVYYSILARHAPMKNGQDENKRYLWTCSYIVHKQALT